MDQKRKNTTEYVIQSTRDYLDSFFVEERLLDAVVPSLEMELFGEFFASPIMTPAFSHMQTYAPEQKDGMCEYSKAMALLRQVNWIGMGENEEFARVAQTGARTVKIIKPYADRDKIFQQIEFAASHGALAVGVDIDHSFGSDGNCDSVMGEMMSPLSSAELARLVQAARVPFVVKGVLSSRDAVKCAACGAQGIVVSHHHGRMPYAVPPLKMLPEIRAEVGNSVKIFVDCSIDTGADAFKALALGADAVSAGRVLLPPLKEKGCQGVIEHITTMNEELRMLMAFTGNRDLQEINADVLHRL